MVHNLFDEFRFFFKYPPHELTVTAVLFGQLVEHFFNLLGRHASLTQIRECPVLNVLQDFVVPPIRKSSLAVNLNDLGSGDPPQLFDQFRFGPKAPAKDLHHGGLAVLRARGHPKIRFPAGDFNSLA